MLMIFKYVITYIFSPILITYAIINMWESIKKEKCNHISIIIMYIYAVLNISIIPQPIRIYVSVTVSLFCLIISYKDKITRNINIVFTQSIITMISELSMSIIMYILLKDDVTIFLSTWKGTTIINVLVGIVIVIFNHIGIPSKIYNTITKITDSMKTKKKVLYTIVLLVVLNIVTYYSYYNYSINIVLLINGISLVIYTTAMMYIFKVENKSEQINKKYNYNLNALLTNEKILDEYKTNSHEYTNTIRTIKNMIEINDPNVLKFINSSIKDLESNDKKILELSSKIPISGLRSLIHSKLILMKNNKIKYSLYIDKKIKNISIDDDTTLDICKITGIFLDNAIEEVKTNKVKKINIYIYQDKDLFIEISNNYNNISFKSKKGKNRGYGLKLVDKILDNNNKLSNTKRINNNIFTQTLKIKSTK